MARHEIPQSVLDRDGPFAPFKRDGAIVTVELADGTTFGEVLLVYPNAVWAVRGHAQMPFDSGHVVRVFQRREDLRTRTTRDWVFFGKGNAI